MRTDDDVRNLPPFVLMRIKTSRDWDRFLVAQAQRYLGRALPEVRARRLHRKLTRVAAGLNGDAERLTPVDVFARMEPLLESFSELEDLCPRPKVFPVGIRRPKPLTGPDESAGPLPDPWLVAGPLPDPWLVAGPLPDPWFVAGPLPDPWFVGLTPVEALPVLDALDTLAEAFTDVQAARQFGEVLADARDFWDWVVSCPEGDAGPEVYDHKQDALRAAHEHNAQSTPRHHASIRLYDPEHV
ncbi:hypothetical protein [Streptomyces xanthophaeus]|uniref:hypothetical protein n=1 Tax=Streptomyces xanthophaeus TaxID=67385 RepID=UPI002649D7CA|nr:hypothetical protein [Streptomyces xanthophaeus]WKD31860.1 hypothetical protein KO717_07800 [Streptomyces xanthophaeus]